MLLLPKNRKYRKAHKNANARNSGPHRLTFGSYGLKSLEAG
jgi:hypothetical protein